MTPISVNVVAFEDESGLWVAHCVDYDIVATASSLAGLEKAFEKALVSNLCVNAELGQSGLVGIPPAPDHIRRLFEEAPYERRASLYPQMPRLFEIAALRVADSPASAH